jgi:predicted dehydrogenase
MDRGNLSRRGFIQRSLTGLAAAGLPLWYAREVVAADEEKSANTRKPGPNDRINIGLIGTGDRCKGGLQHDLRRHKDFIVVAACDVDDKHCDAVAKEVSKHYKNECAKYHDFRDLCARKDLDAVVIATPDHWHALTAIAAMKAGKDVYCEKPLSLTVQESQAILKVARATDRIFQVGSQQRSDYRFRLACELVRNGRIGKVQRVETRIGENPTSPPLPDAPVPEGLDWNFWLGQTPEVSYVSKPKPNPRDKIPYSRCHYEFRWWYEYSGGKMTDWGAHHNDIAQWGLGMDESGPTAVAASKVKQPPKEPNCYNCHPDFTVEYTYANGTKLICTATGENGVKFVGDKKQFIFVSREQIAFNGKAEDVFAPLPKDATRLYVSNDHMGNWRDCLRERKRPICDVEIGHRSVTVCHIGNIAIRSSKKLKWDPAKEQFLEDEEANKWLSREMRAPWKLEV